MGGKRKQNLVEWVRCEPCRKDVRNCIQIIDVHNSSPSHMRYVELFTKQRLLKQWNVQWAPTGRAFYCYTCNVSLSCSFDKIEKHYADNHTPSNVDGSVSEQKQTNLPIVSENLLKSFTKLVEPGSTEGVEELSRGHEVLCVPCRKKIPNCSNNIECHNGSSGHKRFVEISSKMGILNQWNIDWAPTGRDFVCRHCDVLLGCSFAKLESHFVKHHTLSTKREPQLNIFKVFRRKKFYDSKDYDFNAEKGSFRVIEGPLQLNEAAGCCVGLIGHRVVPDTFASKLYGVALDLEAKGRETVRGPKKQGSRMVMYGMHNRGHSNWFTHEDKSLYAKSERFVKEVAHYLRVAFPTEMAHMWKNLEVEGLPKGEGGFADTPFTQFAITRDYNCAPHDDPTDYGFGFFLWLHSERIEANDVSTFWLNEYKICFRPTHASAFYFNGAATVHCTTTEGKAGMLGLAFVQKRDFITGLARMIVDPNSIVAKGFRKAKVVYERDRDSARPDIVYRRAVNRDAYKKMKI